MRMGTAWADVRDRGGKRLRAYSVTRRAGGSEFYVHLHGPDEVALQVAQFLAPVGGRMLEPATLDRNRWTHGYRFDGPYSQRLHNLLEVLQEVLTLRSAAHLDWALALDFYKRG